jgi:hypothetical protein
MQEYFRKHSDAAKEQSNKAKSSSKNSSRKR